MKFTLTIDIGPNAVRNAEDLATLIDLAASRVRSKLGYRTIGKKDACDGQLNDIDGDTVGTWSVA